MAQDKKNNRDENKIREGTEDYSIHQERKDTDQQSYPKLSTKDQRYKDQPEFLDNNPNKLEEES